MFEKNNETSLSETDSKEKVKPEKTILFKIKDSNDLNLLNKKTLRFEVKKKNAKRLKQKEQNSKEGRWTFEEHIHFLEAISKYGTNWKKIEETMLSKSRTRTQIISHFQKFFKKLKTCKDTKLGIDFTSKLIVNLEDMVQHIKSVNNEYNVVDIFIKFSKDMRFKKKKKKINVKNENEQINVLNQNNNINLNFLLNNNFLYNTHVNNNINNLVPFKANFLNNTIISKEILSLFLLNLSNNYIANNLQLNVIKE